MNPEEIRLRTDTLVATCIKVGRLIPARDHLSEMARVELLRRAADLGIISKSLSVSQVGRYFGERLNKAIDHVNGCAFWMQLGIEEGWMDAAILTPIVQECDNLSRIFILTVKNVESKLDKS
ncbi:MAG: hypothetical protein H6606_06290 [Flavobacteriales bacterium]|nr:hypothetical protein [Flavobacteriales bacterium]